MHFSNISTSKSGPRLTVFNTFYFQMCFASQRPAFFQQVNFQKWSREWCALTLFTSTCALRHNAVQCFISHLPRWRRTRRFSKPTFRPWKNIVFRDFPYFSRTCNFRAPACIFSLLTFSLSDLLSSDFHPV